MPVPTDTQSVRHISKLCQNEGLEKGKPVRIASRMLGGRSTELYFRFNRAVWSRRFFFTEVPLKDVSTKTS